MNNYRRLLSLILVAVLVLSASFGFTFIVNADEKPEISASFTADFETQTLEEAGITFNKNKDLQDPSIVSTTDSDGNPTKALRLHSYKYKPVAVILPFKMQAGKTYKISFSYRTDRTSATEKDSKATLDKKSLVATCNKSGTMNAEANRFGYFMQESGDFSWNSNKLYDNDWHDRSITVTANASQVTDTYNTLAIQLSVYTTEDTGYFYIDNISVYMQSLLEVKTNYPSLSYETIMRPAGTVMTMPDGYQLGYNFVGWYKDSKFETPYTDTTYTFGSENETVYAKYERLTSAVVDFDNEKNYEIGPVIRPNWHKDPFYESEIAETKGVDGKKTKAVKMHVHKYNIAYLNLPMALEAGESYVVSYNFKTESETISLYNTSVITSTDKKGNYLPAESAFGWITGSLTSKYLTFSAPDVWQTFSTSFVATEEQVADGYNTLALSMASISTDDLYVYVDNISITKVSTVSFVTDNPEIKLNTIIGNPGSSQNFDCLSIAGYDVAGVYTDDKFSAPYTESEIVFADKPTTLYVKYTPATTYRFKMENSSDVSKISGSAMSVVSDPVYTGNHVLQLTKSTSKSYTVFPYELKPNTSYALKISYRASSEVVAPKLYIYGGSPTAPSPIFGDNVETGKQFSFFDVIGVTSGYFSKSMSVANEYDNWINKEYTFTTSDMIDDTYKFFTLSGRVVFTTSGSANEYLYIDNIEIKELDATVSFDVSYDGLKIDVDNMYPSVGETVNLPQQVINPFQLEGWYENKEFTKPVQSPYTVTQKNVTLYGKVSKRTKTVIDFESSGNFLFNEATWHAVGHRITVDPENPENHLLYGISEGYGNHNCLRFNYQLLPNRIYTISMRYRAKKETIVTGALSVSAIKYPENGYGVDTGTDDNALSDAIFPFESKNTVGEEWLNVTATVSTDQPVIDSTKKYLTLDLQDYMQNQDADDGKTYSTAVVYIDDIVIEDIGTFDPTNITVDTAARWKNTPLNPSVWTDWKQWITGTVKNNTYDGLELNEADGDLTVETDNKTTKRRKVIKKVIVTHADYTWVIIVSIVGGVLVAGGVVFIIIYKRKKRQI